MKKVLVALALLALAAPAFAGGFANTTSLAVGANAVWFDNQEVSPDYEAAANGAMSLSPHISAVGSVNYGVRNAYYRSTVGVRVTASDVENKDFSVGLGLQYQLSNWETLKPNEWCPVAAVGFRPWPKTYPDLAVTGLGWYGLDTKKAGANVGLRYRFDL